MPAFVRSVRFRLALTYSVVVFGLAGLVVAGVNIALSRSLQEHPVTEQIILRAVPTRFGVITFEETIRTQMLTFEDIVYAETRKELRRISMWALIGMFPVSIGAGYLVAGRVLRPIDEITEVATDIQSDDLSRRIRLLGPDDELTRLADTFDAMLDRLEDGSEERRAFIQDMSHELRNPLAVMATNLDLALTDEDPSVDSLQETARIVRRTVDRTSRTVDDLLTFAREGVPTRAKADEDLAAIADEVLAEYAAPIDEAGIVLENRLETVPAHVDRVAVKRALGNLVANAIHHTPESETLLVASGQFDGWAWLGIEDGGAGIEVADHESVFQRHWTTNTGDARGLGLAIVRQVAEGHGGVVTMRSQLEVGSTFVVWIPIDDVADPSVVTADGIHHDIDPFEMPDE